MIKNILVIYLVSMSSILLAQIKDSTLLQLENVEVVKKFQTILSERKLIPFSPPVIPDAEKKERLDLEYSINAPKTLEVEIEDPEIRTLAFIEEKTALDANNGFAKIGYGNLKSPDLFAQYHYYIEDWFEVGVKGNYYAAKATDNPVQKTTDTGDGLYAGYFINDRTKVKAEVNGSWDKFFLYKGINSESLYIENDLRKRLNDYNGAITINHSPFKSKGIILESKIFANHFNLSDSLLKESIIGIDNRWGLRLGAEKNNGIYTEFTLENYSNRLLMDTSLLRISLNPYLLVDEGKLNAQLGIYFDNQKIIWPHTKFNYSINKNISLKLSSGVDAELNTLKRINTINPFWLDDSFTLNQYANRYVSTGISYRNNVFQTSLSFSRNDHKNFIFFSLFDERRFSESYYDLEEYSASIRADILLIEWLDIGLSFEKKFLTWDLDRSPDYLSDILASLNLSQNFINDKLRIRQDIIFSNPKPYFNDLSQSNESLDYMLDLNLGIDFTINKNFAIYGEFNNVLNRNYSYWDGYNNFGLNIHGGLKLIL